MKIRDETKDYIFQKADIFMDTLDRLSFWAAIIATVGALIFIILPALIKIFES